MYAPLIAIASTKPSREIPISLAATIGIWMVILKFHFELSFVEALLGFCANIILFFSYHVLSGRMKISVSLLGLILFGISIDLMNVKSLWMNDHLILADYFSGTNWTHWYSYTGILGGSLWILVVNSGVYLAFLRDNVLLKKRWLLGTVLLLLIVIPIVFSKSYLSGFDFPPTGINSDAQMIFLRWEGLLVAENPDNEVTSMWKTHGEYIGRTAVWLSSLLVLSFLIRLKTNNVKNRD